MMFETRLYGEVTDLLLRARSYALKCVANGESPLRGNQKQTKDLETLCARGWAAAEALRVTTRLNHGLAWLLLHRAIAAGELSEESLSEPQHRLPPRWGEDPTEAEASAALPNELICLLRESRALYIRLLRLDSRYA